MADIVRQTLEVVCQPSVDQDDPQDPPSVLKRIWRRVRSWFKCSGVRKRQVAPTPSAQPLNPGGNTMQEASGGAVQFQ